LPPVSVAGDFPHVHSPSIPAKLQSLVHYLDSLTGHASIERLNELLTASHVSLADVRDYVRYGPGHYPRPPRWRQNDKERGG